MCSPAGLQLMLQPIDFLISLALLLYVGDSGTQCRTLSLGQSLLSQLLLNKLYSRSEISFSGSKGVRCRLTFRGDRSNREAVLIKILPEAAKRSQQEQDQCEARRLRPLGRHRHGSDRCANMGARGFSLFRDLMGSSSVHDSVTPHEQQWQTPLCRLPGRPDYTKNLVRSLAQVFSNAR